jgi:flagellar hook-associated protein 2
VYDPAATNLSTALNYTLTIGTGTPISLTASTLQGLADQIQSLAGDQLNATVVNIGSVDGRPDYRLSLQGRTLAPLAYSLEGTRADASQFDVLAAAQKEPGKNVSYSVNGASAASSTSRSVALAPGLTLDLKKADPGTDVTVAVTRSPASVQKALSSLADAYNAAVAELDRNTGTNTGSLKGNSIISTLSRSLASIALYTSDSGSTSSLASLGLVLDKTGKLSLDNAAFADATRNGMDAMASFLGGAQKGGLLQMASDALDSILHPDTGVLTSAESVTTASSTALSNHIGDEQTRIDDLQTSLAAQMAAADASIAAMEQQATFLINMFDAMQSAANSMK